MDSIDQIGISAIGAIATGIISVVRAISFVKEGEEGIKLRFGEAVRDRQGKPVVIKPGFLFMIPFVETLVRRPVRQQTIRLEDQKVVIQDGLIFNLSAMLVFKVSDVYKALFEVDHLEKSVTDLTMGLIRDHVSQKTYVELHDTAAISEQILLSLMAVSSDWGINVSQFRLINCAPTPETGNIINVAIATKFRVEALRAAAKTLETDPVSMSPSLAAALVGIPIVAAVAADQYVTVRKDLDESSDE